MAVMMGMMGKLEPMEHPPEVNSKPVSKLPAAKPGADLLPEMHPSEKKESIKSGLPTTPNANNVNLEWKVKKRPDGTRYITCKPIRNPILKEQAQIINQERLGLTTDDDAMSELKVGPKDRKRKEMLLRQIKMC
uniref:Uncharacterized protein n=1 Tax=Tetranychus urticae TaxID=32264 RepID=T1KVD8_TETUR